MTDPQLALLRRADEAAVGLRAAIAHPDNPCHIACGEALTVLEDLATFIATGLYTAAQVEQAVNAAASLIQEDERIFPCENSAGIQAASLLDLLVAAVMGILRNPGATLNEVIAANWGDSFPDKKDEDIVGEVIGWVATG